MIYRLHKVTNKQTEVILSILSC